MAMTSYLDFAENDYKYFMTSYEHGIVANAMAADALSGSENGIEL